MEKYNQIFHEFANAGHADRLEFIFIGDTSPPAAIAAKTDRPVFASTREFNGWVIAAPRKSRHDRGIFLPDGTKFDTHLWDGGYSSYTPQHLAELRAKVTEALEHP